MTVEITDRNDAIARDSDISNNCRFIAPTVDSATGYHDIERLLLRTGAQ